MFRMSAAIDVNHELVMVSMSGLNRQFYQDFLSNEQRTKATRVVFSFGFDEGRLAVKQGGLIRSVDDLKTWMQNISNKLPMVTEMSIRFEEYWGLKTKIIRLDDDFPITCLILLFQQWRRTLCSLELVNHIRRSWQPKLSGSPLELQKLCRQLSNLRHLEKVRWDIGLEVGTFTEEEGLGLLLQSFQSSAVIRNLSTPVFPVRAGLQLLNYLGNKPPTLTSLSLSLGWHSPSVAVELFQEAVSNLVALKELKLELNPLGNFNGSYGQTIACAVVRGLRYNRTIKYLSMTVTNDGCCCVNSEGCLKAIDTELGKVLPFNSTLCHFQFQMDNPGFNTHVYEIDENRILDFWLKKNRFLRTIRAGRSTWLRPFTNPPLYHYSLYDHQLIFFLLSTYPDKYLPYLQKYCDNVSNKEGSQESPKKKKPRLATC